jgi:hypothetical protein
MGTYDKENHQCQCYVYIIYIYIYGIIDVHYHIFPYIYIDVIKYYELSQFPNGKKDQSVDQRHKLGVSHEIRRK